MNRFWRNFRRHYLAVISFVMLCIFALAALFAPIIAPHDPNDINIRDPRIRRGIPEEPSREHPFGTDNYSRDIFSRCLYGMRISMGVGVLATLISILLGVSVGVLAGYMGGLVDNLLMRIVDVFLAVPAFLLYISLNAILEQSLWNIIILLGLFSWMNIARLVRAEIISLKERDFILAARSIGVKPHRTILVHMLPNTLGSIIVAATLSIPAAILSESALSFIGLGVPPPNASLGNMLQDARSWIFTAWWMWVAPGAVVSLIVLMFNFLGDGLRDALDPSLRRL